MFQGFAECYEMLPGIPRSSPWKCSHCRSSTKSLGCLQGSAIPWRQGIFERIQGCGACGNVNTPWLVIGVVTASLPKTVINDVYDYIIFYKLTLVLNCGFLIVYSSWVKIKGFGWIDRERSKGPPIVSETLAALLPYRAAAAGPWSFAPRPRDLLSGLWHLAWLRLRGSSLPFGIAPRPGVPTPQKSRVSCALPVRPVITIFSLGRSRDGYCSSLP